MIYLVPQQGLEPPTPSLRTICATDRAVAASQWVSCRHLRDWLRRATVAFSCDGVRANDTADCKLPRLLAPIKTAELRRAEPRRGSAFSGRPVAYLALELGRRLPGLHHHRAELPAAAALSHDLGRQLFDGLGGRCDGLSAEGSKLGLGERWSSTPLLHRGPATNARRASSRPPCFSSPRSIIARPLQYVSGLTSLPYEPASGQYRGGASDSSLRRTLARGVSSRRERTRIGLKTQK
jgi:hypothetical protein